MGKRYLIDTNVLIEYIGQLLPNNVMATLGSIMDNEFNISFVNKIELLGHASAVSDVANFINAATVFYIDDQIIDRTIVIRKKSSKIKLPDAVIAATAVVNDFVLLTRNIDDFKNIDSLKIENPWEWAEKD